MVGTRIYPNNDGVICSPPPPPPPPPYIHFVSLCNSDSRHVPFLLLFHVHERQSRQHDHNYNVKSITYNAHTQMPHETSSAEIRPLSPTPIRANPPKHRKVRGKLARGMSTVDHDLDEEAEAGKMRVGIIKVK